MSRRHIILIALVVLVAGTLMRGSRTARAQLPTLHVAGTQVFFAGQPVDSLTVGTKVKRYTVQVTGVGFDASAKVLVNGMKIPVLSSSSNELTARFKGLVLTPGELSLQVVNPDGEISNAAMIEVVSDPSALSISAVSPGTGIVGAQVTVTGVGFTATGNTVQMVNVQVPTLRGVTGPIDSADGKTLTLKIPSGICPPCVLSTPPCLAPCFILLPGSYRLSVSNFNGLSNSVLFLVSSTSGPIGVWGSTGDRVRVTVTDTQVMVEGLCFTGMIQQTLIPDAMGNFILTGSFSPMIGPAGVPQSAQYSGSINGTTMTLSITTSSTTLGPFTLTFGNDVQIVHPCV